MVTKEAIVDVIRAYNVRLHYLAARDYQNGGLRYAVFGPGGQCTEPATHRVAVDMLHNIVAQEVLDLFEGDQSC